MQPQHQQHSGDATIHYQQACRYADWASGAYQKGEIDTFDMLLGLAELQAKLGHLSLAVSRRQDYVRRGNGGNRNST